MAALRNLPQGADLLVKRTLLKFSDNTPVDLTTYDGIVIYLNDATGLQVAKWNYPTKATYGVITLVDAANGILSFNLESLTTSQITPGETTYEIKLEKTDATFQNSTKFEVFRGKLVNITPATTRVETDTTP